MSLDIEQLDQILMTLWPKPSRHASSRTGAPSLIKVRGQLYRRAETIADKLLALSVEMQDYDIPNLDGWTELANRMLAALELGKDKIDVAGKEFTAQHLYDTLGRVFKQTQEKHQQLWHEKDKARKRHLDQYEPRSRNIPEFYRDPELKKPVMEAKPPVTRYDAQAKAPSEITFRGAVYLLAAAPTLPPKYNIPVTASDLDPEVISWFHAGQGDPVYALGSRLYAYGKTLASEDELSALEYTLETWLANHDGTDEHLDRINNLHLAVLEVLKSADLRTKPQAIISSASARSEITFRGAKYRLVITGDVEKQASAAGYLSKDDEHRKMVFDDSMGYRERIYAAVMLSKVWDKPEWRTVAVSYDPHRDVVTVVSDTDKWSFKVTTEGTDSLDYLKQHGFVFQHDL